MSIFSYYVMNLYVKIMTLRCIQGVLNDTHCSIDTHVCVYIFFDNSSIRASLSESQLIQGPNSTAHLRGGQLKPEQSSV